MHACIEAIIELPRHNPKECKDREEKATDTLCGSMRGVEVRAIHRLGRSVYGPNPFLL